MTEARRPGATGEAVAGEVLRVMAFMLSSAKLLASEPKSYGPYRLIDAAGRLGQALERCGLADDSVKALSVEIERQKYYGLEDEAETAVFLDRVLEMAAGAMKRPGAAPDGDKPGYL